MPQIKKKFKIVAYKIITKLTESPPGSSCKKHGIRLSGPKLGRPSATTKVDKKQEYQDNTNRIEVERTFSLSKRCYGMSCITTKLEETQLTSIALSVFVTNLFRIQRRILYRGNRIG